MGAIFKNGTTINTEIEKCLIKPDILVSYLIDYRYKFLTFKNRGI